MKHAKKLASLLLALVMVFAMSVTAFATGTTYSITISKPASGDTYSAWKIFDVSYADTDNDGTNNAFSYTIEKNGTWWNDVLNYMGTESGGTYTQPTEQNGIYTGKGITLTKAAGTENTYVVTVSTGATGNDALNFSAPAFAEFLATKTASKTADGTSSNVDPADDGSVTISLTKPGYYLVTCSGASQTTALAELTTAAPNVTIYDKNVPPAFDKQQSDTSDANYTDDALDVQIGDTVNYKITSAVPDLTGYTAYTFEVSDILSEGLTLNMDSTDPAKPDVTIKVGETNVYPVTSGTSDWTVTAIYGVYENRAAVTTKNDGTAYASTDDGVAIVGFKASVDLVGKNYAQGAAIEITYSAVVNEKAVSGVETNEATLKYSNDPNDSSKTDTETDKTKVYDASIAVLKYDGATSDNGTTAKTPATAVKYLSGAEFVLYKTEGEAPNTTTKYYKYETSGSETNVDYPRVTWTENKAEATVLTTSDQGKLEYYEGEGDNKTLVLSSFAGLEDGTYYLLETAAPAGYNLMEEAISVTVSGTGTDNAPVYAIEKPIANNAGTLLPSTGGMGTTLLYIIGAVLVVGAGVLLIVRRRMRVEK